MLPVVRLFDKLAVVFACALLAACSQSMGKGTSGDASTLALTPTGEALAFQADGDFGKGLSSAQRSALTAAESQALESGEAGQPITWGNQGGAVFGSVTVTQPFRVGQSNCRRFTHNLTNKSKNRQTYGTACQRGGGSWRLVQ